MLIALRKLELSLKSKKLSKFLWELFLKKYQNAAGEKYSGNEEKDFLLFTQAFLFPKFKITYIL